MLTLTRHGTHTDLPRLLIAHGLFGSGRNWGAIAKRMAKDREVIAVDMRNHAGSFWSEAHDYPAMAGDLAEVIAAEGHKMDVLGHSMGGKAAMMLALTRPELVNRLVVADIAPISYGHSQNHLIAAMKGLDLTGLNKSRSEADARLGARVDDASVRAFLLQSLDLKTDPPRWRLNLEVLETQMDTITGWPEVSGLGPYDGPALFIAGAQSDYVPRESRAKIRALFRKAQMMKIPGAGHWLHAEKPREFEAALRVFLD